MIQVQCLTGNSLSVINNSHCEIGEEIVQSRAQYGAASASVMTRFKDGRFDRAGHYLGTSHRQDPKSPLNQSGSGEAPGVPRLRFRAAVTSYHTTL